MVTQVASNGSIYNSNTIEVTAPASAPDVPYLDQNDSITVNDLTSITVKVYFPEDYSDGNSALTNMAFSLSSDSLLYSRILPITQDSIYVLEDLSGNVEYEIAVSAMNSVGPSGISNTILESTTAFPSAPRNFIIFTEYFAETENTKVTLKWNAPTNDSLTDLDSYYIYHSTDNSNFTLLTTYTTPLISSTLSNGSLNMMSQEYLNVFTTVGETHYFYMKSHNLLGLSVNPTNTLSSYIFNNASVVRNVTCIPGDERLNLSWIAPSNNGGYEIVDYKIQVFLNDSQVGNDLFSEGDTNYNITGLTNGNNYTVKINAITYNDNGNPNESFNYISYNIQGEVLTITNSTSNCSTIPFTNPTEVQDVVVVPSDEQISVSWSAPSYNGGYSIDHYVVGYSLNGVISFTNVDVASNVFTHIITGLTNGTSYDIHIYAVNSATDSSLSTSVGLYVNVNDVIPFRQASIVNNLTVVPGNNILDLSWTDVSDNGGFQVVSYNIYLDGVYYDNTVSKSFRVQGLTNGTSYSVSVSALTYPDYLNPNSLEGDLNTSDNNYPFTNPSEVQDVVVVPSDEQITVSWAAPLNNGGYSIDHYVVGYRLNGSNSYTTVDIANNVFTHIITGLTNGTSYDIQVYAVSSATDSSLSTSVGLRVNVNNVIPFRQASIVNNLTVVPENNALVVSWNNVSDNGGFPVVSYNIYLNGELYANTSSQSYTIQDLTNGTSYNVSLSALTYPDYLSPDSLEGNLTTSDNYYPFTTPEPVIDLSADPSNHQIEFSWNVPDYTGGFEIDHYEVALQHGSDSYSFVTNGTNTSVTYNSLQNGDTYTLYVKAVTINLNDSSSLYSSTESVSSVPYTKPEPVNDLSVVPGNTILNVYFTPLAQTISNNGGYNIIEYKLGYRVHSTGSYNLISINPNTADYNGNQIIYTISALTNGTGYDVEIYAISDTPNGNNNASDHSYVYNSIPYTQATQVNNLVVTPLDINNNPLDARLGVTWSEVSYNGGFPVVSYNVYVDGNLYANTSNRNNLISGLTNGTYYTINVVPVTYPAYLEGDSLEGLVNIYEPIKPFKNPDPVDDLQVIPLSLKDKEISVSWDAPQDNGGNAIVDYRLSIFDMSDNKLCDIITDAAPNNVYDNSGNLLYSHYATFNIINTPSIANGTTYKVTCKVRTVTDAELDLYSSVQTIYPKPYGRPNSIYYTINTATNELSITIGNNGSHISDILICAPLSADATAIEMANILVTSSDANPVNTTENPLIDTFTVIMNYQLSDKENQPVLIVATNGAGMYFIENFSSVNQIVPP
jgi:hypothetical protein